MTPPSRPPSTRTSDIVLGRINGSTYSLRQSGGQDDTVIETSERIELVRTEANGRSRALNEAETRQAVAALGIGTLPRSGCLVKNLSDYVASIRQAQTESSNHNVRGVVFQLRTILQNARLANMGPDIEALVSLVASANPNFQGMPRERQDLVRNNTRQFINELMNGEDDSLAIARYLELRAAGYDVNPPRVLSDIARRHEQTTVVSGLAVARQMARLDQHQRDIANQMGQIPTSPAATPLPTSSTDRHNP